MFGVEREMTIPKSQLVAAAKATLSDLSTLLATQSTLSGGLIAYLNRAAGISLTYVQQMGPQPISNVEAKM